MRVEPSHDAEPLGLDVLGLGVVVAIMDVVVRAEIEEERFGLLGRKAGGVERAGPDRTPRRATPGYSGFLLRGQDLFGRGRQGSGLGGRGSHGGRFNIELGRHHKISYNQL